MPSRRRLVETDPTYKDVKKIKATLENVINDFVLDDWTWKYVYKLLYSLYESNISMPAIRTSRIRLLVMKYWKRTTIPEVKNLCAHLIHKWDLEIDPHHPVNRRYLSEDSHIMITVSTRKWCTERPVPTNRYKSPVNDVLAQYYKEIVRLVDLGDLRRKPAKDSVTVKTEGMDTLEHTTEPFRQGLTNPTKMEFFTPQQPSEEKLATIDETISGKTEHRVNWIKGQPQSRSSSFWNASTVPCSESPGSPGGVNDLDTSFYEQEL